MADRDPQHLPRSFLLVWAVGLVLRLHTLGQEPIWEDEAYSINASLLHFRDCLLAQSSDVHPPGYYLLLSTWFSIVPMTMTWLRLPSVAFSVAQLIVFSRWMRTFMAPRTALLATLLLALDPLDLYHAQQGRMYSLAALCTTGAASSLWRYAADAQTSDRPSWRPLGHFVVWAWLAIHTHYLSAFALGIQVALAAGQLRQQKRPLRALVTSLAVLAGAALPWALFAWTHRDLSYPSGELAWIPPLTLIQHFGYLVRDLVFGTLDPPGSPTQLVAATLVLTGLALATFGASTDSRKRLHLWALLVGPVGLVAGVSAVYGDLYYPPRFCVFVAPAWCAVLALGLDGPSFIARGTRLLLVALLATLAWVQNSVIKNADPVPMVEFWTETPGPSDVVAVVPYYEHEMIDAVLALEGKPTSTRYVDAPFLVRHGLPSGTVLRVLDATPIVSSHAEAAALQTLVERGHVEDWREGPDGSRIAWIRF